MLSGVSYRVVLQLIIVGDDEMSRGWRKTALQGNIVKKLWVGEKIGYIPHASTAQQHHWRDGGVGGHGQQGEH